MEGRSIALGVALSELMRQILVVLIPSVIVAIVTALLTVRLSIRQFHSQRWWEKKAETYSAIPEHLSELQFIIAEDLDYWEGTGNIDSEERSKRLQAMSHEAQIAIAKAAGIGSFIISDEAAAVVEKLHKELHGGDGSDPLPS